MYELPRYYFCGKQCARFCDDPKASHEAAVKYICCYLPKTQDRKLFFKPDKSRSLECYVEVYWAGLWTKHSLHDSMTENQEPATQYSLLDSQ